jgi:hypothetical protein
MTTLSDEMLMAYADDELAADDRAKVEAALAQDPAIAGRLAAFAATGRALGKLYSAPMLEPVPQRLIDAVVGPAKASATVISFNKPQRAKPWAVPQWAIAASVSALVVAAGMQWQAKQKSTGAGEMYGLAVSGDGVKIAGPELASALNSALSATSAQHVIDGQPASIKPVFSFEATSGTYCRQYQIDRTDAPPLGGVGCRIDGVQWQIEGQVAIAAQRPAADGKIVPAGRESSAAVDAMVDKIIGGDVMGTDAETAAIKEGWRKMRSESEPQR